MKKIYELRNWDVGYNSPNSSTLRLRGEVYGHPKHKDGRFIVTSRIVSISNGVFTTLSGSKYRITKEGVNPAYEEKYPNAFDRLFSKEAI